MSLLTLKHPKPGPKEGNVSVQAKVSPWNSVQNLFKQEFFFYPDETSEENKHLALPSPTKNPLFSKYAKLDRKACPLCKNGYKNKN